MTSSSGPNNNRSPRGPRIPQWLADAASVAWDILRAAEYAEMRRESEERIRQKIEDEARLRRLIEKNLGQEIENGIEIYIKEKLEEIIVKFENEDFKKAKAKLQKTEDRLIEEVKNEVNKKLKSSNEEINFNMSKQINRQSNILKTIKDMEPELFKLRTFIILIPAILIAFSVFFKGRIDDIMSIDALQTEIKHLQEDVKALQPSRGQGARQPWAEPPLPPWGDEP